MKGFAMLLGMLLSGCVTLSDKPIDNLMYVPVPLSMPDRPTLPTFGAKDIACLSIETKQKLLERDRMRSNYSVELETIIRSTNK